MRIMQVMAGAQHGGAEAFFERLTLSLTNRPIKQHVVIRRDAERLRRLEEGGAASTELAFGGLFDFWTPYALKHIAKSFSPDIVLTWMNRASRMMPPGPYIHAARLGGYYDLKYYRTCDHLIGNTKGIVDYLIGEGWPVDRAHYIPNFVDEQPGKAVSRIAFETPEDVPLLLALGRLHENKAFDVLIEALKDVPFAHLWLAGEGPLKSQLVALAQERNVADRVHFLGWREDIGDMLASADLLICPSRHEPLGNVILEAWAHNIPVIAASSQGPCELIDNKSSGVLVPINAPGALAGAINEMIKSPAIMKELAVTANACYEQNYSEAAVVNQYLAFFEKVSR